MENKSEHSEEGMQIKKAIEVYGANRSTENLLVLLNTLMNSFVWVPCTAKISEADQEQIEEMLNKAGDDLDSLLGRSITSKEETHFVPDILQNNAGHHFFPVFSSCEEMGKYGEGFSKIQSPFLYTINLARNNPDYDVQGIVVNAFTNSIILRWDLLEVIENAAKQGKKDIAEEQGND